MAFVEHDETEPTAEVLHVEVGGVVGGDGQWVQRILAAPDHADLDAEARAQEIVPLPHEVERRGDDQRAATPFVDRHDRDVTLAGARRQDHDAAPLRLLERVERLALKGPRLPVGPDAEVELGVFARLVLDVEPEVFEREDQGSVGARRRPKAAAARIPPARAGQAEEGLRDAAKLERSCNEMHGRHPSLLPRSGGAV
jgi:hypothetical protein